MLGRQGDDLHRQLRISYYSTGGDHWGLTSGFERARRKSLSPLSDSPCRKRVLSAA